MTTPSVAFIGHLASLERYRDVLTELRGPDLAPLSVETVEAALRSLAPMPLADFHFRSTRGREVHGRYVELWLPVDATALGDPGFVRAGLGRVRQACDEARAFGARIAALGGFSSIVGEGKLPAPSGADDLALTTGNSLTAAIVVEQLRSVAPPTTRVTVVGAAGDVGSAVCRLLAEGGRPLALVGRSPRPLQELARELKGSEILELAAALRGAEVLVLVASTAPGALAFDGLASGAVVLDVGHPPNASARAGVRYATAGRIVHAHPPLTDLGPALVAGAPGENHACLAEALVLAYEERFVPFSRGRGEIKPAQAHEILGLARRHGIEPAPLHYEGGN
jgi:fatty aldehyde-generating acyl-ACP reductase